MEGFAEKEGFKSGMKERVGDGKLIMISMTVSGINDRIRFYHFTLVLRLGHATGGAARVLIRTCCGLRQRLVATWAEFQHSVVYYATDQCRKRQEACIHAEGGHSEHLL